MSSPAKVQDPAFQGVGQKPGTEIWRIENFQPTTSSKGGSYLYDIHFWIGKDTSKDEAGTAAIKTIDLDSVLGGCAVQHRELQGHESDKFLSYFKPCIIPLEGGFASGFKKAEEEEFEKQLYVCKGKRVVRLKKVPFARSSLNHDDVFILDTQNKIYQFNGANTNIQERAKALEVIQFLKEKYHDGTCNVAVVDDGKLDTESTLTTPAKLYSITDGEVKIIGGELSKGLLENNKCYILDCGAEVFVWIGRVTQVEDRKAACQVAEDFVGGQKRPKTTRITRVIQGYENNSFKSNFDSWPAGTATVGAEGRGKVAALLKQQGAGVKGTSKSAPVNEEVPPLLEGSGKMEVWCINASAKTLLPKEDVGKFYSGDCYVVLYTYHWGGRKEDYFLCCWIGKDSIEEDQKMAARLANTMFNSLKGRPVQGRVFEGKEPPQFIALFQPMVVLKGGYKKSIEDKGLTDETYTADCVALFQISGTAMHNNKALQVDAVATSLNSTECFLLQSGSSIFTWHGNQSTFEQQQLAAKVAEFLKPGGYLKHAKEGTESNAFWSALGGKQSYTIVNEACFHSNCSFHDFVFVLMDTPGKFEVEEVYNFTQDDLLTEDILIFDTHAEVFVWVGQSVNTKERQNVFEIGQKYIDFAASLDGLSPNVPLYKKKVALLFGAGHSVKSNGNQGGPTQRASALAALSSAFNPSSAKPTSSSQARSNGNNGGPTQRASALAALSSAFNSSSASKKSAPKPSRTGQGSQREAAVAALSAVLTAEKKTLLQDGSPAKFASSTPVSTPPSETKSEAYPSEVEDSQEVAEAKETSVAPETNGLDSEPKQKIQLDENGTYSYEQLKAISGNAVTGINLKRTETYLSDKEFQMVFGMEKEAFYRLPKWKQDLKKKKVDLF
ncbi:Villin-3 [Hibiscus syriacus]|uniref:Villin-3 n=1 Tax=Hibiscus syriacus TaxID=106335 RepID=A0A6A2YW25_HIBSY|nr:Villin-3 [Hibiscus syriacus]